MGCKNWFMGSLKVKAILQKMSVKTYGHARKFWWAPDARVLKTPLLLKLSQSIMAGWHATAANDA